ncbi:MAG TPA: TIGR03435 family protein [Terracidiphilus sp.]|nr:TIGR03435 family protein [Terracidiphilus sp.]
MRSSRAANFLLLLPFVVCMAIESPACAQNGAASSTLPEAKTPAYEVISIRPNKSAAESAGWRSAPDGIVLTNAPLSWLVRSAFNIISDNQLAGLPSWVDSDHYDIQAKMDEQATAAWKNLTRQQKAEQQRLLIQALLADRCQLKIHRETKQLPVYELVIAKGGLKMKEAATAAGDSRFWSGTGQLGGQSTTIENLVDSLGNQVGRVVIDKTGLGDKKFDFDLKWTPDDQQGTADAGPSIYAALEEQLGLKLVSSRGPVETVVVDHMEKPSPN